MSKTAIVRARMDPELKKSAEAVLSDLGVSTSNVITMLYTQLALRRRLPDALISGDERKAVAPLTGVAMLKHLPVGLWKGRSDMGTSTAFARTLCSHAEHARTRRA